MSAAGTTTTPSSSATTTSPGRTATPAQTTGTLTQPSVDFTVPFADMARDQTGKPICWRTATSRAPASITKPRTPRAFSEVAKRSPNIPSVLSVVQATTSTSPARHCSAATWIIQLSPGCVNAVTTLPATRAPGHAGRMYVFIRFGARPDASCVVATPNLAKRSTILRSARGLLVTTTVFMSTAPWRVRHESLSQHLLRLFGLRIALLVEDASHLRLIKRVFPFTYDNRSHRIADQIRRDECLGHEAMYAKDECNAGHRNGAHRSERRRQDDKCGTGDPRCSLGSEQQDADKSKLLLDPKRRIGRLRKKHRRS